MSNYNGRPDMEIYTDGACHSNGQRSASGGVGVYFGPGDSRNYSGSLSGSRQTNQRAELAAINQAVSQANESARGYNSRPTVVIKTDSQYSIDSLTKWNHTWDRNGWVNQAGNPVANQDLIQGTLNQIRGGNCDVRFEKVSGHSGNRGNDAAHNLATRGARNNNRRR
ncbi:hypothetical protein IW146_002616 [Coemansia sp. RSA 922]|nr:hypothetical protein GGH13_003331 [Coemansia sp. S155-1]KAJ2115057.1 hypothetical protein IW146_002616 [Coemansia sp. RSA 922]